MWGDIISAGANLIGGMMQNQSNEASARQAQAASAAEAQKNRDWQEHMSNTSYQRGIADMKAAGLSPMLAYSQGGASTPSGSTGIGFQAQYQNVLGGAVDAFNRSRDTSANVGLKKEQETQATSAADLNRQNIDLVKQSESESKARELSQLENIATQKSQQRLNSANEAAAMANAYKTSEEGKFVAFQRAEVEAKSPLWNMLHGVTKKVSDMGETFNAHQAAAREYIKTHPYSSPQRGSISRPDRPRSGITIYGNSK